MGSVHSKIDPTFSIAAALDIADVAAYGAISLSGWLFVGWKKWRAGKDGYDRTHRLLHR